MRHLKTKVAALVLAVLMVVAVFPAELLAAQRCTVTFRAGNVGSFDVEKIKASIKDPSLVSVEPEYVKLTAERGQKMQELLGAAFGRTIRGEEDLQTLFLSFLSPNAEYCMREVSVWGPAVSDVVLRNTEFVVDYGMLVEPVPYKIFYVEKDSGEEIAAPVISYGNDDEQITAVPVKVDGYETKDSAKFFRLSSEQENEVTFYYAYTGSKEAEGKTVYRVKYWDVTRIVSGENQRAENPPASDDGTDKEQKQEQKTPSGQNETETTIPEQEVPLQAKEDETTDKKEQTQKEKRDQTIRNGLLVLLLFAAVLFAVLWKKKNGHRR